ncbi:MAG: hypothetical protein KGR71_18390 [Proteobacteria bacterium]|nr:hypothetical protein [Pseudomonadota bacterium]
MDVEAYGEVVWFGRPDAGVKLAVMLRITPATVTTKPGRREEHEGNRKTIAQEMPDVSGGPVVTNARAFYTTRAAAGALSARHFLRPHLRVALRPLPFWGGTCLQNSDKCCRENASAYLERSEPWTARDERPLLRHSGMREAQARNPYAQCSCSARNKVTA